MDDITKIAVLISLDNFKVSFLANLLFKNYKAKFILKLLKYLFSLRF